MRRPMQKEAPFGGPEPGIPEGIQAGFTLIQLLSSMLLTLTVCALMFAAMNLQRAAVGRTETSARMQEQLQFALKVMAHHLRMAGYGVGYEVVGSVLLDSAPALLGCDACGHYNYDSTTQTDLATGTDQVGVIYRGPSTEFSLDLEYYQNQPASCGTSSLVSEAGTPRRSFPQGTVIVCMDDGDTVYPPYAYAWTLEQDVVTGSDGTTESGTGAVLPVLPNNSLEFNSLCADTLPVHLRCGSTLGSAVGFYIRNDTLWMDDDGDSLVKVGEKTYRLEPDAGGQTNDIPLARGIEDLQLAFCVPGNADVDTASTGSTPTDCLTNPNSANWYDPGILSAVPLSSIRAVRISLVARGPVDPTQRGLASPPPHVENHQPTATSNDVPYQRMVQSTVVQLPNLLYPMENEQAEEIR